MKKLSIVSLMALLFLQATAQDPSVKNLQNETGKSIKKDPNDTLPKTWKTGGLYSLSIGQGSLNNWAAGGDEFSLSINSILNLHAFYKRGKNSWDNTLDFNFGYVKTTSLGSRKNDDRIDLLSKYGHALNPKFDLSGIFNFRSQFFKGYSYGDNTKTLSSAFFSPAYVLLGAGINYKPTKHLSIFLSPLTTRWVIVTNDSLSAHGAYGVDPGKKSRNEIGAFASISYLKEFNKSVTYNGRLDLFSNYRRKPQNVDVYFTNTLSAKLGKTFAMTWSVDMIYDDDVRLFGPNKTSAALQLKSIIGIGLQVKI